MNSLFLRASLCIFCLLPCGMLHAQTITADPPEWFCGMADSSLLLLVKGKNISALDPVVLEPGIQVLENIPSQSPDYLLLRTSISAKALPGTYQFVKRGDSKKKVLFTYKLLPKPTFVAGGISASDMIYLLMPDRFSNGDASNDAVTGMQQTAVHRDSLFERHGGDLQGVIHHLGHIQELGATALWMNPFQENDQPKESYHGYAITNHYRVDPRLGNTEDVMTLSNMLHSKNMKLVMDIVPNHCGNRHYLFRDKPFPSWFHEWENFTRTNYRAATMFDPYRSALDSRIFSDAWFDRHMPDFNQSDSLLGRYLIQSYLWWTAKVHVDALRIDTYAYSDEKFMQELLVSVQKEFPGIGVFGEIWDHAVSIQSSFQQKAARQTGAAVPGITDFMLNYSIASALTRPQEWTEGVAKMYYTLSQDYLYAAPQKNVVFLDNHDVSRFFSVVGEDVSLMSMGITWLLTTRGIPCMYYGTEILMKNYANPDGKVRSDFPGGWKDDKIQAFDSTLLNADQQKIHSLIRRLCRFRKSSPAICEGSYKHFIPENGVYVYAREHSKQKLLVMMNPTKYAVTVDLKRFAEVTGTKGRFRNILSGETTLYNANNSAFSIPGKEALLLEILTE